MYMHLLQKMVENMRLWLSSMPQDWSKEAEVPRVSLDADIHQASCNKQIRPAVQCQQSKPKSSSAPQRQRPKIKPRKNVSLQVT